MTYSLGLSADIRLAVVIMIFGIANVAHSDQNATNGVYCKNDLLMYNNTSVLQEYYAKCTASMMACTEEYQSEESISSCQNNVRKNYQYLAEQAGRAAAQSDPTASDSSGTSKALQECKTATEEAADFCKNPVSAITKGEAGGGLTQMGMQLGLGAGSMFAQSQGMKQYCDLMKYAGGTVSGLNAALGARCMDLVNSCELQCDINSEAMKPLGPPSQSEALKFRTYLSMCRQQKGQANAMAASAAQALQGYSQGKLCGDIVDNNNKIVPRDPPTDVVPPNTNCQLDPTNPFCRTVGGGGGGGGLGTPTGSTVGNTAGSFNTGELPGDIEPGFNEGGGVSDPAKSAGVPNGGGGFPGGGANGSFGGGDEKARGPGSGYNTNIVQGERGGGGYSSPSGGGWSGYGQGGSEGAKKSGSGFDLSKYLPGGEKGGPGRGPAGMVRINRDVGAIHEDIFKKMSDRIIATCSGGTINLRDCRH